MSQYEQENDLGRGGGEVDDETREQAEENAERRRGGDGDAEGPQPWAKTSSGDADDLT